jgi:hypothetical protein
MIDHDESCCVLRNIYPSSTETTGLRPRKVCSSTLGVKSILRMLTLIADGALSPIILVSCLIPMSRWWFAPTFCSVQGQKRAATRLHIGAWQWHFASSEVNERRRMFQLTSLYERNVSNYDFEVSSSSYILHRVASQTNAKS